MADRGGSPGKALGALVGGSLSGGGKNPVERLLQELAGGDEEKKSGILASVMSAVQGSGGIGSVIELFRRNGLGGQDDLISKGLAFPGGKGLF